MLRLEFAIEDVAALRFAISPLAETVSALRVYGAPERAGPHRPWLHGLDALRGEVWLQSLLDLVAPDGYCPDFLSPPPATPLGDIDTELATVAATPADVVIAELELTFARRPMGTQTAALHADPTGRLPSLIDAMRRWHAAAIAPHWSRVYGLLSAEVALQSRLLAEGGPARALRNLHPAMRWQPDQLLVTMEWEASVSLNGRGLLLVPSAFWPGVGPIVLGAWQPTLIYAARGVELMWQIERTPSEALAGVLGSTRAQLLTGLEQPATTTELAHRLKLTAPGVSQHLQRLRAAGLVSAARDGRKVRYRRTTVAERLLDACEDSGAPVGAPKSSPG